MDQNNPVNPPAGGATPPPPPPSDPKPVTPPLMPTNPSSLPSAPDPLPPAQPDPLSSEPTPAPSVTQAPEPGSKKTMMMILIVVLVVAILGVGGYMVYQMQMGATPAEETSTQNQSEETSGISELNEEVEGIIVTNPDGQFMEVDKEITALEATPSPSLKASPAASTKASTSPSPKASVKASATP